MASPALLTLDVTHPWRQTFSEGWKLLHLVVVTYKWYEKEVHALLNCVQDKSGQLEEKLMIRGFPKSII